MDTEQTIAENRVARAHLCRAGHQTEEPEWPLGCESKARREAGTQSLVSALAAVWRLLPPWVPCTPT